MIINQDLYRSCSSYDVKKQCTYIWTKSSMLERQDVEGGRVSDSSIVCPGTGVTCHLHRSLDPSLQRRPFSHLFPFQAHSCHRSWLRPSQSKWNDSLKCMNFISFPSRMLLCSRQSLVLPQVTIPFGVAVLFLKKGPYSVLFPRQSLPDYILFNDEGHLKCFFPTKAKPQGGASCKF